MDTQNILQIEVELLLNRVKHVNEKTCVAATLLIGEKGAGKTFLTEIIAKLFCGPNWKDNYLFYQCHEGTTPAHFLYDVDVQGVVNSVAGNVNAMFLNQWVAEYVKADLAIDRKSMAIAKEKIEEYGGNSPSTLSKGILVQACEKSQTEKVVLVIDEFDKTPRAIDAFFLDFLQNFRVKDPIYGNIQGNKANIVVVFTSNDERLFSDPFYRRIVPLHIEYPNEKELFKRLKANLPNTSFKDDFLVATIVFVEAVRSLDLFYKPVLSEIMTLLIDLEQLKNRNPTELTYFVCRTLSPDLDDRVKISNSEALKKYIKEISKT